MAASYSSYEYYRDSFGGALGQAEYEIFARRARDEIDYRCFGRAAGAPGCMAEPLARCECELADTLHAFALLPVGVAAVNNDGYSQSFGGAEEEKVVHRICKKHLCMPENLMAGTGVVRYG